MENGPVTDCTRQPDVDEREMARYRARLGETLASRRAPRPPIPLWAPLAAAVGVVAAALVLLGPGHGLPQRDLDEIESLAEEASPRILALARGLAEEGEGLDRWNALMLLTLTEPTERAVRFAARGVQEDPRADFRFFYLEFLLEEADEYRYNLEILESLMDRETDSRCLRLYGWLHRLNA